jgi:hypothetical protein
MSKTLCKLEKSGKGKKILAENETQKPAFVCRKCHRQAFKKKWLCKPLKIDKNQA